MVNYSILKLAISQPFYDLWRISELSLCLSAIRNDFLPCALGVRTCRRPKAVREDHYRRTDNCKQSIWMTRQVGDKLSLDRLSFLTCQGGWPESIGMDDEIALDQAFKYYDVVVNHNIQRVDGVRRDNERAKKHAGISATPGVAWPHTQQYATRGCLAMHHASL